MIMKMLIRLIILGLVTAVPAQAIPLVWGEWSWEHDQTVHLMVSPGGNGPAFTEAVYLGGGPTDATIRIQLWFQSDMPPDDPPPPAPVANFPAEDLWLEVSGMYYCSGGTTADANTDDEGWFTFSLPPRMGGWAEQEEFPYVMVVGVPLTELNGPYLRPGILFNSPDINGDGSVNLADVGLFSTDFHGEYSFRSDFHWDGVLNLSDVGRLATGMGSTCP